MSNQNDLQRKTNLNYFANKRMNLTSSQNEIFANAFRLGVGIGNMLKLCEI